MQRWALHVDAQAQCLRAPSEKNDFKLCAGAVVRKGRGAPASAPAPAARLSTEKHICVWSNFSHFLPVFSYHVFFTMTSARQHGSDFVSWRLYHLPCRAEFSFFPWKTSKIVGVLSFSSFFDQKPHGFKAFAPKTRENLRFFEVLAFGAETGIFVVFAFVPYVFWIVCFLQ